MFNDGWQTEISNDQGFQQNIFIFREAEGGTLEVMYPQSDGSWRIETHPRNERFKPSLSFSVRQHRGIFKSLAENLAQMGYSVVDTGTTTKAQAEHIASLKNELDRLERIVSRSAPPRTIVVRGEVLKET